MKTIMFASVIVAAMVAGVALAAPSGSGSGVGSDPRCACIGCVHAFLFGEFSNLVQNATKDKIQNCAALSAGSGSGSGPRLPSGSGSGFPSASGFGSGSGSGFESGLDSIPYRCIKCVQEFLVTRFALLNQTAIKELTPKQCPAVKVTPPKPSKMDPCKVFTAVHKFFFETFSSLKKNATNIKCGPLSLPTGFGSGSGSGSALASGSGSGPADKCFIFTVVRGFFEREFFRLNMIMGPKPFCDKP